MNRHDWERLCAFWGIVIATALFVVLAILHLVGASLGIFETILDLVAKIALLVAVAIPGYDFVRGKRIGWKVTYWVALVLYIVFIALRLIQI